MTARRFICSLVLALTVVGGYWLMAPVARAADPNASANTFTPELGFPGFTGPQASDSSLLPRYIKALFTYFIWTVGILATFMVIYAGVRWVSAAGNASRIQDARETLNNAIIGVIIALTSVVLLNTISPRLTKLTLQQVTKVNYQAGQVVTGICPQTVETECGTVVKVGSFKDANHGNVATDRYCLAVDCRRFPGTVCDVVLNDVEPSKQTRNGTTNYTQLYAPGKGCVSSVDLKLPASDPLSKITTITVEKRRWCGVGYTDSGEGKMTTGSWCDVSGSNGCIALNQPVTSVRALTTQEKNGLGGGASYHFTQLKCDTTWASESYPF